MLLYFCAIYPLLIQVYFLLPHFRFSRKGKRIIQGYVFHFFFDELWTYYVHNVLLGTVRVKLRWVTLGCSRSVLVFVCWIMDHMIYLKLRQNCLLLQDEQTNFFQSKWPGFKKIIILSKQSCHFVNLFGF